MLAQSQISQDTLSSVIDQSYSNYIFLTLVLLIGLVVIIWLFKPHRTKNRTAIKRSLSDSSSPIRDQTASAKNPGTTTTGKPNSTRTDVKAVTPPVIRLPATKVEPEPAQSKIKYIGYNPINIFEQHEPLSFPYVIMPPPKSVIKFPNKGRSSKKGFKEDSFLVYLKKYFYTNFQIFDDRCLKVKTRNTPYEPDFALIDEKEGINIFLDVEIDEPYEGINNIELRKPTHYQYSDTNRNNAYKNRGWIVIRFAEIQIHQNPDSCCRFIADVVSGINTKYILPTSLTTTKLLKPIRQWTREEALSMSRQKFRESYLGIESFGFMYEEESITVPETDIGKEVEEIVKDDPEIIVAREQLTQYTHPDPKREIINTAIASNLFLSFSYDNKPTIVKATSLTATHCVAYCYVKNKEKHFELSKMVDVLQKQTAFTVNVSSPILGIEQVTSIVNTAIQYNKYLRIRYTRAAWSRIMVDENDEIVIQNTESEESLRTICNVQRSLDALDSDHINRFNLNENYITAYCNLREEQRTFRFDRISNIAILNF